MASPTVALLDYGAGNLRSAQRALESVGATVTVTADPDHAITADGLVVPGVGSFDACMRGLTAANGPRIIADRLAEGRPVLGICIGLQVLFSKGTENGVGTPGCAWWPGVVDRLHASVLPHMGWNTVDFPPTSRMFAGIAADARFYFVHSYGVHAWSGVVDAASWTTHGGDRFVAAIEDGPAWATQFHPEKSGGCGLSLLRNWLGTL